MCSVQVIHLFFSDKIPFMVRCAAKESRYPSSKWYSDAQTLMSMPSRLGWCPDSPRSDGHIEFNGYSSSEGIPGTWSNLTLWYIPMVIRKWWKMHPKRLFLVNQNEWTKHLFDQNEIPRSAMCVRHDVCSSNWLAAFGSAFHIPRQTHWAFTVNIDAGWSMMIFRDAVKNVFIK